MQNSFYASEVTLKHVLKLTNKQINEDIES